MYVCMYIRMYVCMNVHICIYIYTYIGACANSTAKESYSTAKETYILFRSPPAHTYGQEDKENVANFGERVRGRKSHAGSRSSAPQQCSLAKVCVRLCVWGGGGGECMGGFKGEGWCTCK
jgi:hypothetical protein